MKWFAALALAMVLAGCSASGDAEDAESSPSEVAAPSTESEPSVTSSPSEPTTTVGVVVVTTNVLGQSCEALSGVKRGLHNGARVVIESSTGEVVGSGRLGDPPRRAPKSLCAWGADIVATLVPGEQYLARAATRFTSPLRGEAALGQGQPLVIDAG